MKDWRIRKLLCATVDNISANDTIIEWLRRNTTMIKGIVSGNEFMLVRCATHILNLIVVESLKEANDSILMV